MADTWCTKDCEKCLRFERKACPGCKSGASRVRGGECEIAVCCQGRGFDNCGHCPEYVDCRMLDALDPIEHLEDPKPMRLPAATARKMANGMTALFALALLLIVTSVMTMDSAAARWPALGEAGDMLAAVVGLAYYAVLLYMAGANTRYRRASFAGLAAVAVNVGALLISAGAVMAEATALALLVSLAGLATSYYALCCELEAHSGATLPFAYSLSKRWRKIWKWNLLVLAGVLVTLLLMLAVPTLALLLSFVCAIAALALKVVVLVSLWNSAEVFRKIQKTDGNV